MFIASMSHELRTPLNSIIGITGIILQRLTGEINKEQEDQLRRVYNAAKHLLSLITDIIDISKIEAGKVEPYIEEFMLDEVINEAVSGLRPQIDESGLEVDVSVPKGLWIKSDRKRLMQCVINYLSNALKFTEKGTVTIKAARAGKSRDMEDDMVEIAVTDTGIGIKDEDREKLFRPFIRLHTRLKHSIPGTGLGLYLVKKLATEVLKEIRKNEIKRIVPVIAITSYAMAGDRERIMEIGCNGYIEKPIDPEKIIEQIKEIIGDKRF